MTTWTMAEAIELCRLVEAICPAFGCHVGLTGGCLYKDGERKDADLLFYRVRQEAKINVAGLFDALQAQLGLVRVTEDERWMIKATLRGKRLDCLFPDLDGGDYNNDVHQQSVAALPEDFDFPPGWQ